MASTDFPSRRPSTAASWNEVWRRRAFRAVWPKARSGNLNLWWVALGQLPGGTSACGLGAVGAGAGHGGRRSPLKPRLAEIGHTHPDLEAVLRQAASGLNGTVGDPRSFGRMHRVLQAQHYRLAYWRVAADEINYRRFFDI